MFAPFWWMALLAPALAATSQPFDADWRFWKGDVSGAEQPAFNDRSWRALNLPHDWSIEGPFDEKNPTGQGGGYLPAGVGWYRKHFTMPASEAARRVFVDFDGVMANSDIWINGFHLGKRPYGYVSFRYELTGHLNFGAKRNVLAVRVDNAAQPASRWYAGAGIYRHVRLVSADPVHVAHWGTFVSAPKISPTEATVRVETVVENESGAERNVSFEIAILSPGGAVVGAAASGPQTIAAGKAARLQQDIAVERPERWDLDHPALYRAVVRVREGKTLRDEDAVAFGIREFRFDPDTGFWLNGRNFKIKGVCLHGDAGALGTAVPMRAWERRLETLRSLGVNAIRTAHNPPAPEFLDLADRMGFLVMDEMFDCWTVAKNPYDYHLYFRDWSAQDTRDTVVRDRNHPSVILYSAGNEIHDTPKADLAKEILGSLIAVFHRNDPTRPVTQALFRPNVSHDYDDGLADMLDVIGQNYRENEILAAHAAKPARKIIGTENQHGRAVWLALRDNPPYAGQFLWSSIDYLGEAGAWPNTAAHSGLLDKTGGIKPAGYERQSWWAEKPIVHIVRRAAPEQRAVTDPGYEATRRRFVQTLFRDWTPANLGAHEEDVEVYSNCGEVELSLNGKSLGSKPLPADATPRTWRVAFEPGVIRAACKDGGPVDELRTAGKPVKIALSADRAKLRPDWDDVAYVTARVVDDQGVTVPSANQEVAFRTAGPGVIAAVDSADNSSHEPFQASSRRAYEGECVAIVKAQAAGGRIVVSAAAPGLAGSSVTIATGAGQ
jgi:beta-galactosidase